MEPIVLSSTDACRDTREMQGIAQGGMVEGLLISNCRDDTMRR